MSFESDGDAKSKKRAKRGGGDDKSGGDGGGVRVLYRDFLELVLAEQVHNKLTTWYASCHSFFLASSEHISVFLLGTRLMTTGVACSCFVCKKLLRRIAVSVRYDKICPLPLSVSLAPLARVNTLQSGGRRS